MAEPVDAADGRRRGRVAPARTARPSATRPGSPAAAARRSRCRALRVLVDCANGAASTVAPLVFAQLGIEHEITACEPDGVNINDRRAARPTSTALAERRARGRLRARARVRRRRRPRARASTPPGPSSTATRSSRSSRATCSRAARWPGNQVVVTSMSNLGFHRAMRELGIETRRHRRRRPLRAGGDARARRRPRRRAVRARDRARPPDDRRRAVTAVLLLAALEPRTTSRWPRPPRSCSAFPQLLVNVRADRKRLAGARRSGRRSSARTRALAVSGAGPHRPARVGHRAARARDGRARGRRGARSARDALASDGRAGARRRLMPLSWAFVVRPRRATEEDPRCAGSSATPATRVCKPLLLGGLERLEYRGYDSAGLSLVDGDELEVVRAVGNLAQLQAVAGPNGSPATTGIGHTRWATHGRPSEAQRAPADGLRRPLLGRAERDRRELRRAQGAAASPTATRSLARPTPRSSPHLIETHYDGDLVEAVRRTFLDLARPLRLLRRLAAAPAT